MINIWRRRRRRKKKVDMYVPELLDKDCLCLIMGVNLGQYSLCYN